MKSLFAPLFASALVLGALAACGDDASSTATTSNDDTGSTTDTTTSANGGGGNGTGGETTTTTGDPDTTSTASGGGAEPFGVTSTSYAEGEMIPKKYVCSQGGGDNISPQLDWTPGPAGTQSYAIVMRDQSIGGFLHWVAWDIPVGTTDLGEGVEQVYAPEMPDGMKQAHFNQNIIGYFGPCSPNSVNDYEITIYAIDAATLDTLDDKSTKAEAEEAILQHDLAATTITGKS